VGTFFEACTFRVLPVALVNGDPDLLQARMLVLHGGLGICVAQSFHERCQVSRSL